MKEHPTYEEIQERLRGGYSYDLTTPGLQKAARDLIRPLVEEMRGREIVYECRFPQLMWVEELTVDDEGFHAVAVPMHHPGCRIPTFAEAFRVRKELDHFSTTPEYRAELAALPLDDAVRLAWWKQKHKAAINALPVDSQPFDFGAHWIGLRLRGSAICMNMLTDCFYPDPRVVAVVKAAVRRGDFGEISAILERA